MSVPTPMHHGSCWLAALSCLTSIALAQGPARGAPAKAAAELDEQIRRALDRSRPVLLQKLGRAHGGELALLCLAAVHDSVPRDDKVLVKAMKRLSRTKLGRTYDLSLRLMVASEYRWLPDRKALMVADKRRLLRNITNDGGFDYDSRRRRWDLSNSQYGALGLRAAISMGAKVKAAVWHGLLRAAVAAQSDRGGFGYTAGGRDANVSMTAAGIAVMQLCSDHLDDKAVRDLEVEHRLDAAWEFLVDKKREIGDRGVKNSFYFHYGLERACILSDVIDIDGKDWYRVGASMLLRTQLKDGGWHSPVDHIQGGQDAGGSDSVSTSFAILFLRRKFKKTIGPITPRSFVAIGQLTVQSTPAQVDAAVKSAIERGRLAIPAILRAMRSGIKPRRVAGAKALIAISGEDFGFNPHVSPEKSRTAVSKAELWWLKTKGLKAKGLKAKGPKTEELKSAKGLHSRDGSAKK